MLLWLRTKQWVVEIASYPGSQWAAHQEPWYKASSREYPLFSVHYNYVFCMQDNTGLALIFIEASLSDPHINVLNASTCSVCMYSMHVLCRTSDTAWYCTIVSRKSAHGRSTLQVEGTGALHAS